MRCKQVEHYLSSYIDNQLQQNIAQDIRTHIDQCDYCARLFRQYVLLQRDLTELENSKEPEMSLQEALEEINKMQLAGAPAQDRTSASINLKKNGTGITRIRRPRKAIKSASALAAMLVAGVLLLLVARHYTGQPAQQVAKNTPVVHPVEIKGNIKDTTTHNNAPVDTKPQKVSPATVAGTVNTQQSGTAIDSTPQPAPLMAVAANPAGISGASESAVSQESVKNADKPISDEPVSGPAVEVAVQDSGEPVEPSPQTPDIPPVAVVQAPIPQSKTEEATIFLREQFVPATVASIGTALPVDCKQITNEYGDTQFVFANSITAPGDQLEAVTHSASFKEQIIHLLTKPNCKALVVSDNATARPPYLVVEVPASNYDTCLMELERLGELQDIPLIGHGDTPHKDSDENGFVRMRIIYDISKDTK